MTTIGSPSEYAAPSLATSKSHRESFLAFAEPDRSADHFFDARSAHRPR